MVPRRLGNAQSPETLLTASVQVCAVVVSNYFTVKNSEFSVSHQNVWHIDCPTQKENASDWCQIPEKVTNKLKKFFYEK